MDTVLAKTGGLIALGVVLFWIWKDQQGTTSIIHALGAGHQTVYNSLRGSTL